MKTTRSCGAITILITRFGVGIFCGSSAKIKVSENELDKEQNNADQLTKLPTHIIHQQSSSSYNG